eukprot:2032074-Rhodomonas_salina.1
MRTLPSLAGCLLAHYTRPCLITAVATISLGARPFGAVDSRGESPILEDARCPLPLGIGAHLF